MKLVPYESKINITLNFPLSKIDELNFNLPKIIHEENYQNKLLNDLLKNDKLLKSADLQKSANNLNTNPENSDLITTSDLLKDTNNVYTKDFQNNQNIVYKSQSSVLGNICTENPIQISTNQILSPTNKQEIFASDTTNNSRIGPNQQDLYEPEKFNQISGPWPLDLPLPMPCWGQETSKILGFKTILEYEAFASKVEMTEQRLLEETNYDTVDNFLQFSEAYRNMRDSSTTLLSDLCTFFRDYIPPVSKQHHTCVSLAMELLQRLKPLHQTYPDLNSSAYLVSCEEAVGSDASRYISSAPDPARAPGGSLEKEHVMIAIPLRVGDRKGVLICDPGYHVARVVTVMADEKYPHTGWFTQCDEGPGGSKREYCYSYNNQNSHYVEWKERQHRTIKGVTTTNLTISLVYVHRPYLTAVDVTVRRNLVYNFRSLLSRDKKGQVVAGLYFLVTSKEAEVTLFYERANGGKKKTKCAMKEFARVDEISEHLQEQINECSSQLKLTNIELSQLLSSLSVVMADKHFIRQLLEINDTITEMSA